ncbi:ABC transporter permease [Citricoccus sp. SGAir0253]|uniref:ABC transporter permease n=1 Tax=Citricoccus sp. SGAir0253 TaxID=2567881 RepID=UPI0010CCBA95|nr:ABC transporter permease [Citricoccus sp. SGAir0253]QCU77142.1 ABC transporter permease [Citricoccus sp. SGAir0253]
MRTESTASTALRTEPLAASSPSAPPSSPSSPELSRAVPDAPSTAPDAPSTAPDELRDLGTGLDTLQSGGPVRRRDWSRVLLPLGAVLVLLLAWQLLASLDLRRRDLVPGPLDVLAAFGDLWSGGLVQEAVGTSLQRGVVGFAISVAVGTVLGVLLGQVTVLRRALGPLVSGLQVLPSVAWVPVAVIWFGLTDATAYFVVLMGAIPSIVNGLAAGMDQVPPQFRRVARVLGASPAETALMVVLPAALPAYVSGLKQGWAFAWRSLMAAEIIAVGGSMGYGLGSLLDQGRTLADMGMVMSAVLTILAVGILIELMVFGPVERRILRRRGLLEGSTR